MIKKFIFLILSTLSAGMLTAQTPEDALRFSRIPFGGTARFTATGGAFGAVGADFSSLAVNPAGIGLYRSSEFSITLAPTGSFSESRYNGTTSTDDRVNFGLSNAGLVFNMPVYKNNPSGAVKQVNIGFGLNRLADFNNRVSISGRNMENSLMQNYVDLLNTHYIAPGEVEEQYPFDIGLAYGANLVVFDSASGRYFCDAAFGGVQQNKTIESYGSMNELDFSLGANLYDQLYVGVTVGVPSINYYQNSRYRESDPADTIPVFNSLRYDYNLRTRGTGLNLKAGVIYRPISWFRVGASIHTPTWYMSMRDDWSSSMVSDFSNPEWNATRYSPLGYYEYRMTTPFRAFGSMAFIIGKHGLVSADYEYVDYPGARFNSSDDSYDDVNDVIRNRYQSWGNLRFGTEWVISSLRLRGGFGYFSSPYRQGTNDGVRYQASGGVGYRGKSFFTDLTYVWSGTTQDYYLYDKNMVNPATLNTYTHTVLATIGFRF